MSCARTWTDNKGSIWIEGFWRIREKYDYDVGLSFSYRDYKDYRYALELTPTNNPTPDKKLPNFPIAYIKVIWSQEQDSSIAYQAFREKLQKLSPDNLISRVREAVNEHNQVLAAEKKRNDEYEQAEKAIAALRRKGVIVDLEI